MILNVSDALKNPGQEYVFSGEQAIAPVEIYSEQVTFDTAQVNGAYFTDEDGNVAVSGNIKTCAHSRCANCLGDAKSDIDVPFVETFIRNGDEEDDETFAYEGYQVSMEKLVMSYAVLEVPIRFLCKPDCRGLLDLQKDTLSSYNDDGEPTQHPFANLGNMLKDRDDG